MKLVGHFDRTVLAKLKRICSQSHSHQNNPGVHMTSGTTERISGSRAKAERALRLGVLLELRFSNWLDILPSAKLFNKVYLSSVFT